VKTSEPNVYTNEPEAAPSDTGKELILLTAEIPAAMTLFIPFLCPRV